MATPGGTGRMGGDAGTAVPAGRGCNCRMGLRAQREGDAAHGRQAQELFAGAREKHTKVGLRGQGRRLDRGGLGHLGRLRPVLPLQEGHPAQPAVRRGGRRSETPERPTAPPYEGVVERREDGRSGVWFDPAVSEDAGHRESWAARRRVLVGVDVGRIVLEAAPEGA